MAARSCQRSIQTHFDLLKAFWLVLLFFPTVLWHYLRLLNLMTWKFRARWHCRQWLSLNYARIRLLVVMKTAWLLLPDPWPVRGCGLRIPNVCPVHWSGYRRVLLLVWDCKPIIATIECLFDLWLALSYRLINCLWRVDDIFAIGARLDTLTRFNDTMLSFFTWWRRQSLHFGSWMAILLVLAIISLMQGNFWQG